MIKNAPKSNVYEEMKTKNGGIEEVGNVKECTKVK